MPSWNIHLEVGERVADKMKLSGKEREEFLLGCILPDINNGYNNNVRVVQDHSTTHWVQDKKSSLNFYEKYKKEINECSPIHVGFLLHLYTDGFFNYDYYSKVKETDYGKKSFDKKRDIKHNDFWLYDTKYQHHILNVADKESAIAVANTIENVDVNVEEIEEVEDIINNNRLAGGTAGRQYIFYNEEKLDDVIDRMIKSFCDDYLGARDA